MIAIVNGPIRHRNFLCVATIGKIKLTIKQTSDF